MNAILLPLLLAAAAQSDKLPPANPLPPPGSDEESVMRPVNALFAAIGTGNGAAMMPLLRDGGGATAANEKEDGTRTVTHFAWPDFTVRFKPGGPRLEERLYDPAIEIDGDIAYVWGRYNFYIDGKLHHCGYDHFDLVRDNGSWKIQNITWSSRTPGCEAA
jgi:hypothetical protein